MKTYLVTGGAGFIGSNYIHYMFKKYVTFAEIRAVQPKPEPVQETISKTARSLRNLSSVMRCLGKAFICWNFW